MESSSDQSERPGQNQGPFLGLEALSEIEKSGDSSFISQGNETLHVDLSLNKTVPEKDCSTSQYKVSFAFQTEAEANKFVQMITSGVEVANQTDKKRCVQ